MAAPDRPLRILHAVRAPVGGIFRHILDLACFAGTGAGTAAAITACAFSFALRHNATRIALSRGRHDSTKRSAITLY